MRTITYKQACDVLGVKKVTIEKAVERGILTRCFHNTKIAMLLLEQVALFKGKRLSEKSLAIEEKERWKEYKHIAENTDLLTELEEKETPNIDKETLSKLIEQTIEEKMKPFLLEQSNKLKREVEEAQAREERFRKEHPFLEEREMIAV